MGPKVVIASEQELRQVVDLDLELVKVIENAFAALATGNVIMPPILSMNIPDANAEVDVKTAYIPGYDGFAIKVSPGFFNNPNLGLPSLNGLMILFSAKTGMVQAIFLDNGYLTDLRTAAAGAVAARHLAPEVITTVGVMGTGVQARLQVRAALLVRRFDRVLVWGRDPEKMQVCAAEMQAFLGIPAEVEPDAEKLVTQSQLIITTTPARQPILMADWIRPGVHITAVGSDQVGKNEIDPDVLGLVDTYVCDRYSQCKILGELSSAIAARTWKQGVPAELGDVVTNKSDFNRQPNDITLCDLTGTGAQDTAIATHALQRF